VSGSDQAAPLAEFGEVLIRHAVLDDVVALLELWVELDRQHRHKLPELFGEPAGPAPTLDFLRETFHDRDRTILVAEIEGELVGLSYLFITEAPEHPLLEPRKYMTLDDLVVNPAFRGRGVGEALVETAEEWAKERGAHQFEAEVYDFNEEALDFYAALGYRVVSRIVYKTEW
jgi:GNAT superfamily N-acetyltransferase